MGTSRQEISEWFERGVSAGATHMIVVCDTFDHEDYPVYVGPDEDLRKEYDKYNGKNMQRVMEVYVLDPSRKEAQLSEHYAFHFEAYTPSPTPPAQG